MSADGVVPTAPAAAASAPPPLTADDKVPPGDEYEEIREQVSFTFRLLFLSLCIFFNIR